MKNSHADCSGPSVGMHLDDRRWRQWLEGSLDPGEALDLSAHLREGCNRCEDVLASMPGEPVDLIQAVRDDVARKLARLNIETTDASFRAVMERVSKQAAASGAASAEQAPVPLPWYEALPLPHRLGREAHLHRRPARRWALASATVGVAAALAMMFLAPDLLRQEEHAWDGTKGAETTSPASVSEVSLSFVVARKGKIIRPGRSGDTVPPDADLLFRFHVTGPSAFVYLLREDAKGRELVWPLSGAPSAPVSGELDLRVDGVVHGVSAGKLAGEVRFLALTSPTPLAPEQLALPSHQGLATDSVRVVVETPTVGR